MEVITGDRSASSPRIAHRGLVILTWNGCEDQPRMLWRSALGDGPAPWLAARAFVCCQLLVPERKNHERRVSREGVGALPGAANLRPRDDLDESQLAAPCSRTVA